MTSIGMMKMENNTTDEYVVDQFKAYLQQYYYDDILALYSKQQQDKILTIKTENLTNELIPYFFEIENIKLDTPTIKHNLKLLTQAARQIYKETYEQESTNKLLDKIHVRLSIDDKSLLIPISKINLEDHGDKIIVFEGLVNGTSPTKATIRERIFECRDCGAKFPKRFSKCPSCSNSSTIDFSSKQSGMINLQYMDIQQRLDTSNTSSSISAFSLAQPVMIRATSDLAGKFNIGDIVRVVGFVMPIKQANTTDVQLSKTIEPEFADDLAFDIIVEAHNIERLSSSIEMLVNDPSSYLTKQDIEAILKLREKYDDDTLLKILINSFAPHIYGLEDVKEAIILQLIGSIPVKRKREFIHILLVGDPGTAKSELLNYAYEIALHKAKAVGRGSSGVGLTAGIGNDKKGINKISAGAAVLADRGLCVVDEFSNISDENQSYLLESMEHGRFTMTKVISATFNTRTTFLMAMNPVSGKYSTYNSLKDNIELTDQLISRFDVIFVILDKVDKKNDDRMAHFVLSRFDPTLPQLEEEDTQENSRKVTTIPEDLLKKYLVYAKINNRNNIKIDKDAVYYIKNFYQDLRVPVHSSDVTATPRQVDGTVRLCFAFTRLLLKDRVTLEIAQHITMLLARAYESCGMKLKNSTGMNQTAIYSKPLNKVNKRLAFMMVMEHLTKDNTQYVEKEQVMLELKDKAEMDFSTAYELWEEMDRANRLSVKDNHWYKLNVERPKPRNDDRLV